jgi:hypothetical protein
MALAIAEPLLVFNVPCILGTEADKVRIVGVGDSDGDGVVNPEEPELGDRDEEPELDEGFCPAEPDSSSVI